MILTDKQKRDLMQEYSVWEEDDKGNAKLILPNLGELIYDGLNLHFLTTEDNKEVYCYNGGYYESNGEQIIKNLVEQFLEKGTKEYFKNEVYGYIRDLNYQKREIFNPPVNLINLQNGVFNAETGELLEHDHGYYFLNELPVTYDPIAKCPNIKKFLNQVVYKGDIPTIQEFFGYCLYRRYHIHKACMFLGGGRNGKSTALSLLKHLLGANNVANKELQALVYNRFAVAALYGKLANVSADISNKSLERTGLFKSLTGGDTVDAEKKFKDSFSFVNVAKLIFSANQLPKSEDDTYAFFSRWLLISFPNTFEGKKCKPNILEELTTQEELSGLFNWSIEGLKRLLKNGTFTYGKTVDEVMNQYKTMSDPVYAYCQEFLKCETGGHIPKATLWEHYVKWCTKNKLPVTPKNILTQDLSKHLPEIRTGKVGGMGNQKPAFMDINWQKEQKKGQKSLNPDMELTGGEV